MDDLHGHPQHSRATINRGHQSTPPSHHSLPHFSLALLDPFSTPITASSAGIARSSPPESADQRRRLTPPQASPTVPDASPSTSTSLRTSPSTPGGLQRSPTPSLRRQRALLSPEKKKNHGRAIRWRSDGSAASSPSSRGACWSGRGVRKAPAGFCWLLVDVGVDEEATGTVGEAWGGVNRRR
jgi:hypothetical protein